MTKFTGFDQAVVVDVETTGFNKINDRIVSIALLKANFGNLSQSERRELSIESHYEVIHPERKIPIKVSKIHGIFDHDVQGKPTFFELAGKIREFIGPHPLIAHNAQFDIGFMEAECQSAGVASLRQNRVYCTMNRYRVFNHGIWAGSKLEDVSHAFGLKSRSTAVHDAEEDAMMAFRIAKIFYMMDNGIEIPGGTPRPRPRTASHGRF